MNPFKLAKDMSKLKKLIKKCKDGTIEEDDVRDISRLRDSVGDALHSMGVSREDMDRSVTPEISRLLDKYKSGKKVTWAKH
jgi:hypothetical protein